jgi:hypothetical protein
LISIVRSGMISILPSGMISILPTGMISILPPASRQGLQRHQMIVLQLSN